MIAYFHICSTVFDRDLEFISQFLLPKGNQKIYDFKLFQCDNLQGRDATPYLERNRVGRDAIDAASALTDMGKYLFLERRLPVYDIAVAITKLDMCR